MRKIYHFFVSLACTCTLLLATATYALPPNLTDKEGVPINFIGESSNDLATTVFQSYVGNETNFVFSPFGYSAILAILSEGARGQTQDELVSALHLPGDINFVRKTFKATLQRMTEKETLNVPEFKNYFYVYKNFSVEQNYKDVMSEYYLTDVKSTDRPNFEEDEESSETNTDTDTPAETNNGSSIDNVYLPKVNATDEFKEKEKPKIRSERIKRLAKRFLGVMLDEKPKSNEVSGLSANRLITEKYNGTLSRMIIFNGLYFKGSWQNPFQYRQGEDNFYLTETDKKQVKMIYSVGKFFVGEIPDLDSTAIRIPYKGERYSFLILLPNSRNGLGKLVSDLTGFSFRNIQKHLRETHLQVSIPSFDFHTVSHPKDALKKLGVSSIFTEKADLSAICPNGGLFVDDLVQLVTIHVDNQIASPNFLTATGASTRTVTEKFTADHPFLFFVQDHKENILVAAGKLCDPTLEDKK